MFITTSLQSKSKEASEEPHGAAPGPVLPIDLGKLAPVIPSTESTKGETARPQKIADLLYMPGADCIDLPVSRAIR